MLGNSLQALYGPGGIFLRICVYFTFLLCYTLGKFKLFSENMEQRNIVLQYMVGIIAVIAVGYVIYLGSSVLIPVFFGIFLAYLSDPLYILLHDKFKVPRVITVVVILLVLVALIFGLQDVLFENIRDFYLASDKYIQALGREMQNLIDLAAKYNVSLGVQDILQQLDIKGVLQGSFNFVVKLASSALFVLLFTAFILLERDSISQKAEEFSGRVGARMGFKSVIRNINRQVRHYIVWKTVISLATGLAALIVFLAFGLDAPYLWAFVIFTFNYIPAIGSIVASMFPIVLTLVQFGSVSMALLMTLCMLVIQVSIGNVIDPRVMGNKLNLSPLVVVISLLVWGKLWGISGMFLAVPIMATLNIIMANVPALSHISLLISNKPKRRFIPE